MRTHLPRKEPDDVLGGEDAWKNVDKTASEWIVCALDGILTAIACPMGGCSSASAMLVRRD